MKAIPFTMGDELDDELAVRGRIAFGGGSVTLEIETSTDGQRLSPTRKVIIDVVEFAACRFRRGLLGDRILLRTANMGALGGIPGASLDAVTLRFDRCDREAAADLAERLHTTVRENFALPASMSGLYEATFSA